MRSIVDCHNHNKNIPNSLYVPLYDEVNESLINYPTPFFIGIHPWEAHNDDIELKLKLIESLLQSQHCIGLGEIGLDKKNNYNEDQVQLFRKQIAIANRYLPKRIVIHNVMAMNEIIAEIKILKYNPKILIHDFDGNLEVFKQLKNFPVFVGIGQRIKNHTTHLFKNLKKIPRDSILIETDELSGTLEDTFTRIANQLKINIDEFENIITKNTQNFLA